MVIGCFFAYLLFSIAFFALIIGFILQDSVNCTIGIESCGSDFALGGSLGNRTLVLALANVGAIGISALSNVGKKLGECRDKLVEREEVESRKIYQRKSGRIREESGIGTILNIKNLNVPCGVPAALNFARNLGCGKGQIWEKRIHKG